MKLTIDEKLVRIKGFLKKNKIKYWQNYRWHGQVFDVLIPSLYIIVQRGDDDGVFYRTVRRRFHPVFLRDEETMAFIFEKLQNCIIQQMLYRQSLTMRKKKA